MEYEYGQLVMNANYWYRLAKVQPPGREKIFNARGDWFDEQALVWLHNQDDWTQYRARAEYHQQFMPGLSYDTVLNTWVKASVK